MPRIHDRDRGASIVEYAAVLVLVTALVVAVGTSELAARVQQGIVGEVSEVLGASPEEPAEDGQGGTGGRDGEDGQGGAGGQDGEAGAGGSPSAPGESAAGGDGGGGSSATVENASNDDDDGCGWDPFCHGGNALDRAGDAASDAWEWTTETAAPQVAGFFRGLGEAAWSDFSGLAELVMTNPVDTITAMVEGVKEDPWSLLISAEAREAWANGEYGEAIGRGLWEGGSLFLPGVGWIGKGSKLSGFGGDGNSGGSGNNGEDGDAGGSSQDDGEDAGDGNGRDEDDGSTARADGNPNCLSGNSFVPGTEVLMADGSRVAIESVGEGDQVWAFDPATGEEGPRAVTASIDSAGEKTLVDIEVTGTDGETADVVATEEHPFWAPQAGEWVDAAELDAGTWLRTSAGTWVQVTAVDVRLVEDQRVHNLTVDDLHTYYVGVGGDTALVHNQNDPCRLSLDSVTGPGGESLPLPQGAYGTRTDNDKGWRYDIEPGTEGLDPRVAEVRVMDPKTSGKYPYPNGYVSYMNKDRQTVNPATGHTIRRSDPYAHIPIS